VDSKAESELDYQKDLIKQIFDAASAKSKLSGVQVYHNNFIENGIRALSITFPTLLYFMDEPDFRALAREYLLAVPKTQFDWADYGHDLSDFMMTHPNFAQLPYLSEVAELDYLLHEVQRSEDISFDAASFQLLSEQDPNQLVFLTAPGFDIAKFIFPVDMLHQLSTTPILQEEGKARNAFLIKLNNSMSDARKSEQARSIVVWRPDYKAEMLIVSDDAKEVFQHLNNRDSVASIFAAFAEQTEQLSTWLSEQISQKRIYGVQSTY